MKIDQKKLEKSQLEIIFELTQQEFQKHVESALLHLKEHIKVDGFRKGQVPEKMVRERVGQENLLMEAGNLAVKESYLQYVSDNKLEPIGDPEVQILKIAEGNPFLFKVKVAVLPEVVLPDYKEIVLKITGQSAEKEISVEDVEIEDALNYLRRSRAKFSQKDREAEIKDFVEIVYQSKDINNGEDIKDRFVLGDGGFVKGFEDNLVGMKTGQEKEFSVKFPEKYQQKDLAGKDVNFKVKMASVQKMELPEISDEFAKGIGEFSDLAALKNNIREGITAEKKESEKQRIRGEFLSRIAEKVEFQIPEKLVEAESARLLEDLKNNIKNRFKISFEDYLASVKQTEEELKKTFVKEAEKRIKNFLVLKEIGKKENIEVFKEEIEKNLDETIKGQPFGSTQGKFDIEKLKVYTKDAIYQEKVFQRLESLK